MIPRRRWRLRLTGVMVKTVGVEFFCYHRDRPGSATLRDELLEQHWSYMDRYQAQMIARGPTLAGGSRYLVLGLGAGQAADLAVPPAHDELIAYGPLLSDDAAAWLGTAALISARDPLAARAILTPDRYAGGVEIHNWQFGGRPS
jgi:uncharacterized protein YciI